MSFLFFVGAVIEGVNEFNNDRDVSPPESGGVARSAGVVPKRYPAGMRLWNHPSRDCFAIALPF